MMISICIPIYNFDVTSLVNNLSNQASSLNIAYELLLIDDCSDRFQEINRSVCKNLNYTELPENIGRSKIRNLFLKHAKYEYLLFLDCDSNIASPNFLSKYMEAIKGEPSVVCGGRIYDKTQQKRENLLRWKYGIRRESQPCKIRREFPNKSFMTNNFLIRKKILEEIKFEERISKYGHEDTLFGLSLKKRNIVITHIDNPVVNGDIETNTEYLHKTKEGVINLIQILNFTDNDPDLIDNITILKFYSKIKKAEKFIHFVFFLLKPTIVFLLTKGYVSIYLFDFYKLGIFIENKKIPAVTDQDSNIMKF